MIPVYWFVNAHYAPVEVDGIEGRFAPWDSAQKF